MEHAGKANLTQVISAAGGRLTPSRPVASCVAVGSGMGSQCSASRRALSPSRRSVCALVAHRVSECSSAVCPGWCRCHGRRVATLNKPGPPFGDLEEKAKVAIWRPWQHVSGLRLGCVGDGASMGCVGGAANISCRLGSWLLDHETSPAEGDDRGAS